LSQKLVMDVLDLEATWQLTDQMWDICRLDDSTLSSPATRLPGWLCLSNGRLFSPDTTQGDVCTAGHSKTLIRSPFGQISIFIHKSGFLCRRWWLSSISLDYDWYRLYSCPSLILFVPVLH
jgi:hypothetical protein